MPSAGWEKRGMLLGGLALSLLLGGTDAEAGVLRAWTAYAAGGTVEARVITDAAACPEISVNGVAGPMTLRQAPDDKFPVRTCAQTLPADAQNAIVEGQTLPVPVARPRRIVVFGDTGCRLKGKIIQACNDSREWPFQRVADLAAQAHPDLVIHVGDYNYRENACPAGDPRCAGTPWGDNWATWDAEFFAPASLLLKAAAWVTERGNHEDCRRAGLGWTVFLSADPVAAPCSAHDRPYVVDLGGFKMAVVDDNDADEDNPKPAVVARLHDDLQAMLAAQPDWLLTHHPVRGVNAVAAKGGSLEGANGTLMAALQGLDEQPLRLILSGHIHNFQIENYQGRHPPQLVAGVGGDLLDKRTPPRFSGQPVGDTTVISGLAVASFGYLIMDRQKDGWSIILHGADGAVLRRCHWGCRRISCPL